jgi:RNA polymerase sigma-54 factor
VNYHLKDLEKKNYEGIAKAMNKPMGDVVEMCKIIYDMDPKPGRAFMVPDTHYITPDVYVYPVGDDYVVALNEDGLPRLRVSNFYKNALKNENMMSLSVSQTSGFAPAEPPPANPDGTPGTAPTAQDYIKDKLRAAVWLIKSIHQRQRTIYKVTESIVKHQRDFFDKGPAFIKPMILRDIANDVGIHESTVSRVTTNKYVHTPRGIFELKYFFNSGISTDDGDALASESVKLKIKDLVAAEDTKNPLSDQKLVDLLKKDGINIARRTVAKYRDLLGILPSSRRKKYF